MERGWYFDGFWVGPSSLLVGLAGFSIYRKALKASPVKLQRNNVGGRLCPFGWKRIGEHLCYSIRVRFVGEGVKLEAYSSALIYIPGWQSKRAINQITCQDFSQISLWEAGIKTTGADLKPNLQMCIMSWNSWSLSFSFSPQLPELHFIIELCQKWTNCHLQLLNWWAATVSAASSQPTFSYPSSIHGYIQVYDDWMELMWVFLPRSLPPTLAHSSTQPAHTLQKAITTLYKAGCQNHFCQIWSHSG